MDSEVSTSSEGRLVSGGVREGFSREPWSNHRAHPPFPETKEAGALGSRVMTVPGSSPLTWPSSSWPSPSWRWRRANPTCWAGAGVFWRGGGWGWTWGGAAACWCRPWRPCGTRCGCSSPRWTPSTPGRPRPPAAWPWQSPATRPSRHYSSFAFLSCIGVSNPNIDLILTLLSIVVFIFDITPLLSLYKNKGSLFWHYIIISLLKDFRGSIYQCTSKGIKSLFLLRMSTIFKFKLKKPANIYI